MNKGSSKGVPTPNKQAAKTDNKEEASMGCVERQRHECATA